jgi:hypothetical protein
MAGHAALDTLLCGPRIEYEADHAAGDPEGFARAGACEWTGVYRRPNSVLRGAWLGLRQNAAGSHVGDV